MDYSNYPLFEITKYKIEFLECLEYTLVSTPLDKKEIKNHLTYLNNELKKGLYNQITSSLFESFNQLNKPLIKFIKKYRYNKICNIIKKKKLKNLIKYNESLIDVHETFNYIIESFKEEEKINNSLDKDLLNLIKTNNIHFINFLFFNSYNLYLNCFFDDKHEIKFNNKDMKRLISVINYCNKNNDFNKFIDILKTENRIKINEEFENLSKICIEQEKKQSELLNKLVEKINRETKNK